MSSSGIRLKICDTTVSQIFTTKPFFSQRRVNTNTKKTFETTAVKALVKQAFNNFKLSCSYELSGYVREDDE